MKAMRETVAYVFSVLSLGVGVGMLTYVLTYHTLREKYLGDEHPPAVIYGNTAYYTRLTELSHISTLTAVGTGLLTASLTSFFLIARSHRSGVGKAGMPDL